MKRFKKTYSQGTVNVTEIWVDTETVLIICFTLTEQRQDLRPYLTKRENRS